MGHLLSKTQLNDLLLRVSLASLGVELRDSCDFDIIPHLAYPGLCHHNQDQIAPVLVLGSHAIEFLQSCKKSQVNKILLW